MMIDGGTVASGAITPGHVPIAIGPGLVGDAGLSITGTNKIINGDFRVQQYGFGSWAINNAQYWIDRWNIQVSGANLLNGAQNGNGPNSPSAYSLGITSITAHVLPAGEVYFVYQAIEGLNCSDLIGWGSASAKAISLSFWINSSLTGLFGGSIRNSAGNRCYPFSFNNPVAGQWNRIVITIPGDQTGTWYTSATATFLNLSFDLGCGANAQAPVANAWQAGNFLTPTGMNKIVTVNGATWFITDIQLELAPPGATPAAPIATPFQRCSFSDELAKCQRYYETSFQNSAPADNQTAFSPFGAAYSTSHIVFSVPFKVRKRVSPSTFAFYAGALAGGAYTPGTWNIYFGGAWVGTGVGMSAGDFSGNLNGFSMQVGFTGTLTVGNSYLLDGNWWVSSEL